MVHSSRKSLRKYKVLEIRIIGSLFSDGGQKKKKQKKAKSFCLWNKNATWTLSVSDLFLTLVILIMFESWSSSPSGKKRCLLLFELNSLYLKPHNSHFISVVPYYFCILTLSFCMLACYLFTHECQRYTGIYH